MIRLLENIVKEGKLREFTKTDYYGYDVGPFEDGSEPLIYSSDDYELIVAQNEYDSRVEVVVEDEDYEYYKPFKTKKGAVRYAESIINKLDSSKSISDTLLELNFKLR